MRHTVIGVFDTYAQAEDARSALISAGFARADIELQANPKRDDAAAPSDMPDAVTHQEPGMLANIERFFSMLFGGRDQPPEVAHYSEAVRRGAILVAVDTPSVEQADIARTTLSGQGAIDIDERAASWTTLEHGASDMPAADDRDHSVLDELGLGRGSAVPGREPVNSPDMTPMRARAYPHADAGDPAALTPRDYASDPADDLLMPRAGMQSQSQSQSQTQSMMSDAERTARDPLAGRDPVTGRDPYATTGIDPLADPLGGVPADPLAARDGLTGGSLSERDALAGRDPLRTTGAVPSERDPLPGVRTDMASEWRSVEPLGPLDEPAAPYQAGAARAAGSSPDPVLASAGTQAAGPVGPASTTTGPATVPNEYMEYEEDFRADYESKYSATGEPYEDYQGAYRYGATLGNDDRFRSRTWDDQMEYETRRDWESKHGEGDTWERFKAAIRHGWDRVTGHHHV
ncbi:hypothetical protein NOV72_05628 [Caballeronia novacaledonica]|uniref:General stress protein 17M-like domain-containing protein n=1 Tax=Caballeronia novacaledonica TaxID=1544861 RepID=A0A2U3IDY1_9BURK|nr:hypothetical protein [Caballeronia novacaledonica]SPB18428.1 hypothetical protein NOV72_05628 [Caballeronia novacaledonica]